MTSKRKYKNPNRDGDFAALIKEQQLNASLPPKPYTQETEQRLLEKLLDDDTSEEAVNVEHTANNRKTLFGAVMADQPDELNRIITSLSLAYSNFSLASPVFRKHRSNMTVLHEALVLQRLRCVDVILESQKKDLNLLLAEYEKDIEGEISYVTCLHIMASYNNVKQARVLMSALPEPHRRPFALKTCLVKPRSRIKEMTALHCAALAGSDEMTSYAISDLKIDPNSYSTMMDTPLLLTSLNGCTSTARILMELGANVNYSNDKGTTALHTSLRKKDEEIVEMLLKHGANPSAKRLTGLQYPIILAAALGLEKSTSLLLKKGADSNATTHGGETALYYASKGGHVEVMKVLLENGAKFEKATESGDTALLIAVRNNRYEAFKLLADWGADLYFKDKNGHTIWKIAMDSSEMTWIFYLMSSFYARFFPWRPEVAGKPPLHLAAANGDSARLHALIKLGVPASLKDESGHTFYHIAAKHGHVHILKKFARYVNVNERDEAGETALHDAVQSGHVEATRFLLRKINVSYRNKDGYTALHSACKSKKTSEELLYLIVRSVSDNQSWNFLNARDDGDRTALHVAAKTGKADLIYLLQDINPRLCDDDGDNPLHLAAKRREFDTLDALLQVFEGAIDINQRNAAGETLLHIIAQLGEARYVSKLVDAGADITIQDTDGNTFLHDLIDMASSDIDNMATYLSVADEIYSNAAKWFCMENQLQCPDEDTMAYRKYKKAALKKMRNDIKNNAGYSTLHLAVHLGNTPFVQSLLNIKDTFYHKIKDDSGKDVLVYSVDGLFPETLNPPGKPSKTKDPLDASHILLDSKVAQALMGETTKERMSLLDSIVNVRPLNVASTMLDVVPLRRVVEQYWHRFQWLYLVILLIHLIYMSLLSAYAIPEIKYTTLKYSTNTTNNYRIPSSFSAFLLWPAILLVYDFFFIIGRVVSLCRGYPEPAFTGIDRQSPSMILKMLSSFILFYAQHVACISFSVLVIFWYDSLGKCKLQHAYYLTFALLIGWIYSLAFTSGFATVHSLSSMLNEIFRRDVVRYFMLFIFIYLAFSFSFDALIETSHLIRNDFPATSDVFFDAFQLSIGAEGLLVDDLRDKFSDAGSDPSYYLLLYTLYSIITMVILLNLLIAMMNDSYRDVTQTEGNSFRVYSIQTAISIERAVPILKMILSGCGVSRFEQPRYNSEAGEWQLRIPKKEAEEKKEAKRSAMERGLARLHQRMNRLVIQINLLEKEVKRAIVGSNDVAHRTSSTSRTRFLFAARKVMSKSKDSIDVGRVASPTTIDINKPVESQAQTRDHGEDATSKFYAFHDLFEVSTSSSSSDEPSKPVMPSRRKKTKSNKSSGPS